MTELALLYNPTLTSNENDLVNNWIPATTFSITFRGLAWRYNKNTGKFLEVYDANGNVTNNPAKERTFAELVNQNLIDFDDIGAVDKITNFIINDYNPLINVEDNDCSNILERINNEDFNLQNNSNTSSVNREAIETETIIPSIQGNGITPNNPRLEPIAINTSNTDQDIETITDTVENGALDRLIQQGINEYIKVLDPDRFSFVGTALSPELNIALKDQPNLYTNNVDQSNITLVEGSTRIIASNTNTSQLSISFQYTVNNSFDIIINGSEINLATTDTPRVANVIIKAFNDNGSKVYKLDGISLNTTLATSATTVERTPEAPANQQPSATNQPSIAP